MHRSYKSASSVHHASFFSYRREHSDLGFPISKAWQQVAEKDSQLRARRRAYDCELLVRNHRTGGNRLSLAMAWRRLRAQIDRQRRVRLWTAAAAARRDAHLARAAFMAFARGSRARVAVATIAAARCRASLARWSRGVSLSKRLRVYLWARYQRAAMKGLQRWREQACSSARVREDLSLRLEVFRRRRGKRVVFHAWRFACATGEPPRSRIRAPAGGRWSMSKRTTIGAAMSEAWAWHGGASLRVTEVILLLPME